MRTAHLVLATASLLVCAVLPAARAQQSAGTQSGAARAVLPTADIEHGRYLVERVAMCVECHSGRDRAGNILDSGRYRGATIPFSPPWRNDWAAWAPRNARLPGYTDEMALRLLTEGSIGRDGRPLRPPMPRFRMSRQDAADVIAFMRSLL